MFTSWVCLSWIGEFVIKTLLETCLLEIISFILNTHLWLVSAVKLQSTDLHPFQANLLELKLAVIRTVSALGRVSFGILQQCFSCFLIFFRCLSQPFCYSSYSLFTAILSHGSQTHRLQAAFQFQQFTIFRLLFFYL